MKVCLSLWIGILTLGMPPALVAAAAGPDRFGYTARDESGPGGPTFNFIDISPTGTGQGTQVTFGPPYWGSGPLPIGFPFDFYGTSHTQVFMAQNGYVSFSSIDTTDYYSGCPSIPSSIKPNNAAYVLWAPLLGTNGYHQTFASCPNASGGKGACTVFMWDDTLSYGTHGPGFDIEAILYDNGNILMQYGPNVAGRATIGVENAQGSDALTYACEVLPSMATYPPLPLPEIAPNRAVLFRYPRVAPAPALGMAGLLVSFAALLIVGAYSFRKRSARTRV